jgi:acetylornithine deacetylase/succinyl-diaminopimelate desuccinylase-like protein
MDALSEIEALVACEGRWAGSEGERRAAEHLAGRLRSLGRDVELEPAVVHPDYPLTYVLHILLALVGGAVSTRRPKLGAAALLATIVSAFGDSSGRFHLLRRLTGRAVTHNVLSRERSGKAGTLVLLAHYDAAKTGWLFDPKALQRRVRLSRRIGIDIGLFEPFVWSLEGLLGVALLRALGVRNRVLSAARVPPMLTLAAHVPLLLEIRASEAVPGAADNASGVATVLRLAERHGGRLRHFDLWVLFTGAEEGLMLGMRAWVRRHWHELDLQRTIFVNLDEAGYGTGPLRDQRRTRRRPPERSHAQRSVR